MGCEMSRWVVCAVLLAALCACRKSDEPPPPAPPAPSAEVTLRTDLLVFTNASIWDGTGAPIRPNGELIVQDGRIVAPDANPTLDDATFIDLGGALVMPGLINAHGHVNAGWSGDDTADEAEQVRDGLRLYARYGVTTVVSLGGAPDAAFAIGDSIDPAALDHARFYIAGPVVTDRTAEAAAAQARANVERGVDWLKLRIDDNLGRTEKMPWEAVEAVLEVGKATGIPVATHIFYLADAERLLELGSDMIAHSVRDTAVSESFVAALEGSSACYVPTLTREVSTFAYAERPEFFDDPFFTRYAKPEEVARLSDPEFMQRIQESEMAAGYRVALEQAMENLDTVRRSRARIAFGTDSGPPGRFPGFFEHMELEMMVEAGMSPEEALVSATRLAAECTGLGADVGTLEVGKWADFIVLNDNPLADIRNTRTLRSVYIAGREVSR